MILEPRAGVIPRTKSCVIVHLWSSAGDPGQLHISFSDTRFTVSTIFRGGRTVALSLNGADLLADRPIGDINQLYRPVCEIAQSGFRQDLHAQPGFDHGRPYRTRWCLLSSRCSGRMTISRHSLLEDYYRTSGGLPVLNLSFSRSDRWLTLGPEICR